MAVQVEADHHTTRARVATAEEKPELWRIIPPGDCEKQTPWEGNAARPVSPRTFCLRKEPGEDRLGRAMLLVRSERLGET